MPTLVARASQQFQTALNTWKGASKSMLEWNINSAMIKPKYTQLISSCPAPLSFSFPVSSHHPIFLSSTFSICFLFILLISMPCKLPLPSGSPIIIVFLKVQKISKISHSKFNPKCSFFQETLCSDSLSLGRSGVEWITPAVNWIHNRVQQGSNVV